MRLAIGVAIFVVCAELLALGAYLVETGRLFYAHPRTAAALPLTPEDRVTPAMQVHPYFGFAHRPGVDFRDERAELLARDGLPSVLAPGSRPRTNNFGFISPHAYPLAKRSEDQFFVGIFGGSVGMWFCQVGAPRLVERLKEQAFFRGREVVPLCFAYSGYKQPQLALVLAYFLSIGQVFDLVVNIDGFNDVALAPLNDARGLDISMPSVQHIEGLVNLVSQSTLTPEKLDALAGVFRDRARLIDLSGRIERNRVAALDVVFNAYYRWVLGRYERELGRYAELPSSDAQNALIGLTPPVAPRTPDRLYADIADQWARSSVLMREMLNRRGAAYVHVLQPNQYYTKRRFNDAEAATALTDTSPYKQGVEQGYPVLQAAARSVLQEGGVSFFDATDVLDREPAPVYLADCCHYTLVGNRVFADFVAASILGTPGPWNGSVIRPAP